MALVPWLGAFSTPCIGLGPLYLFGLFGLSFSGIRGGAEDGGLVELLKFLRFLEDNLSMGISS
jgi:hypothetical protein